jgi:tryptophan synthase alpha chain
MASLIQPRGLAAVEAAFSRARESDRAAFIPYFLVGYPDYSTSVDVITALAEIGADVIEVGVPFSDPLADGPTLQAATQVALRQGATARRCIEAIVEVRRRGVQTAMVLMGYANPFMAYGFERLVDDARSVGIDGFVVPDMPADEAAPLQTLTDARRLALPHFLAPTSSPARIRLVAERARGYIYLVSVTGVTGARDALPSDLVQNVAAIRTVAQQPIAIGFGIGTPEQAAQLGQLADGIIVGSALVKAAENGANAVRDLAARLRGALD